MWQQNAFAWALQMYGERVRNERYQAFRFLEEACELGQAMGLTRDDLIRVVDYVMARPVGTPTVEIGDVRLTLDILGEALGIDVEAAHQECLKRVAGLDPARTREKDQKKIEAGLV